MNAKHRKTQEALFARPTSGSVKFSDIEALVVSLGGEIREGAGFRVAKEHLVEEDRTWLADQGKTP